jgi:hypothetical protein
MKKICIVLATIFWSVSGYAGTCTNCSIKNLGFGPYYDNFCSSESCVFVMVEGSITGKPDCSDQGWQFVLDTTTSSGQHTLSFLLSAYTAGKNVTISGTASCSNWNRSEDFRYGMYAN